MDGMIKDYRKHITYKIFIILMLAVGIIIVSLYSVCTGSMKLPVKDVINVFLGKGDDRTALVVFNLRLPRICTALIAGVGLGLSGCVMQSLLRNPLASSSTMGVAQGASFGASFAIIYLGAGALEHGGAGNGAGVLYIANMYTTTICAFLGAMGVTVVILAMSRFRRITPQTLVLTGVALSTLFSGGTTLMQYFAQDVDLSAVVFWSFGDLGRANYNELKLIGCIALIGMLYFFANSWNYNTIESGESTAKSLGVNVERVRLIGMVLCSLITATIISFVGIINFIGLIAPHIMRRLIGSDYRYLLPASALGGALLLLISDSFARLIISPVILPIGAITSFLGAPVFIYIMMKGRDK